MADPRAARAPLAAWDRPDGPSPFTLRDTAVRLGHYRWAELRLFEALGWWVAEVPELDVKLHLGAHTYHHAWHAELWEQRLPELWDLGSVDELVVAPCDEALQFMEALIEPTRPDQTIERLVGAYRVLIPRLVSAYTYHLNRASAVADGPIVRALELCLRDEIDDWRDGEMLLQSLIETDDEITRATEHQARLERLMLAAGGIAGPGSIGTSAPDPERTVEDGRRV